jgi:hypothetical protein
MSKYRIRISYSTGNSFGSHDATDYIELTWNSLDIAKENLQRIKEHYDMYRDVDNYRTPKKKADIFSYNKEKDWFVNIPKLFCISTNNAIDEKYKAKVGSGNWEYRPDYHYATNCLYMKSDNGKKMQLSAFWCGYFEQLHEAEIEIDDTDMKITF